MKDTKEWKQLASEMAEGMKPLKYGDIAKIFHKIKELYPDVPYYNVAGFLQARGFKTFTKKGNEYKKTRMSKKSKRATYVIAKVHGSKIQKVFAILTPEQMLEIVEKNLE